MDCAWNSFRPLGLALLLLAACGRAEGPRTAPLPPERAARLPPGLSPEIALKGGETRAYLFTLPAGWFADLVVEQKGIDVEVSLRSGGRRLASVDSPNGAWGPEPLPFVAETGGEYRLEIRSSAGAAPGRIQVRLAPPRPATAADRTRAAAERALAEGWRAYQQTNGKALRQAIARYEEALGLFQSLNDRGREAETLARLGRLHFLRGDSRTALAFYERAEPLFQNDERRRGLPDVLNGLGLARRTLGDTRRALEDLKEALDISRALGDRRSEAVTWTNLGRTYDSLGETEAALDAHERSIALWQELGQPDDEASARLDLGRLYLTMGDPEKAIDQLREGSQPLEAAGPSAELAGALDDLGRALGRAGRAREGLATLERCRQMQVQVGNQRGEALALSDMGWLEESLHQRESAWRSYSLSRAGFRAIGDPTDEAGPLLGLGRLAEARDPGAATALYDNALRSFEAVRNPLGQATALTGLARCRRRQGDLTAARELVEGALARIESMRGKPVGLGLRTSFLASRQDFYELYVELLMELHRRQPAAGYLRRAFEACELARARGLLDTLEETRAGLGRRPPPDLLARESELASQVNAAERRRSSLVDRGAPAAQIAAAQTEAAERELRRRLAESERLRDRIRRTTLGAKALSQARPADLAEIQRQLLDPDTLLLEYTLGKERSYLWVVTSTSIEGFDLPPRAILEPTARRAYGLVTNPQRTLALTNMDRTFAALSRSLLGPATGRLGTRRLLIVSDGALSYLPFAALPVPGGGGEPLVVQHEIVTAPSASSLLALRREQGDRRPAPVSVAVLADPVFGANDPRVSSGHSSSPTDLHRSSRGPGRLPSLPSSGAEAKDILALSPPGRTLAALGFAASRETVLSGALSRYRILHFATHGHLDTEHPELSGIELSRVDERGRPREGFLGAHEIYRLRLEADLVVLSACDTALGREVRGEGLVGLTRGFFHAGARRVVVSLWPVQDQPTAELMRRFYQALLRDHLPPAAALRTAQAGLRGEPRWRDPHDWAGFVLQGDWK
jgi:CHAT domain-containing protein